MLKLMDMITNSLIIYFALMNAQNEKISLLKKVICFFIIGVSITILVPILKQTATIIVIVLCLLYIFIITKRKYFSICTAILSYLLTITFNYVITSALTIIFGINISMLYGKYSTVFNIFFCILIFGMTFILKKLIARYFFEIKISKTDNIFIFFILIGCLFLFITNFIIAEYVGYQTLIIVTNSISYFFFISMTIIIFTILIKKTKAEEESKNEKQQYKHIVEYTTQLEEVYNNIRTFKHDYINILSTLSGYIEKTDSKELKNYFNHEILPYSQLYINTDLEIAELSNITDIEFKSLFMSKIFLAVTKNIKVNLDIKEPISLTKIPIKKMDLFRILGIFMDNAIEGCEHVNNKQIDIGILCNINKYIIFIGNTYLDSAMSLGKIKELGYSTKDKKSGMGLYNVEKLLSKYKNIIVTTGAENNYFSQKIEIY